MYSLMTLCFTLSLSLATISVKRFVILFNYYVVSVVLHLNNVPHCFYAAIKYVFAKLCSAILQEWIFCILCRYWKSSWICVKFTLNAGISSGRSLNDNQSEVDAMLQWAGTPRISSCHRSRLDSLATTERLMSPRSQDAAIVVPWTDCCLRSGYVRRSARFSFMHLQFYLNANAFACMMWNGSWYLASTCTLIDHFTYTFIPIFV